jgi:elongation factor P hydroxylase
MRGYLLLAFCLGFTVLGCSDERSEKIKEQQHLIRALRDQKDSLRWQLQRRTEMLRDSLQELHNTNGRLKRDMETLKKLRSLLLDNRVGLWGSGDQAEHIHFLDSVDTHSARDLVDAFNARFAGDFNPRLQLQSVQGSVARVSVPDDDQLTERMGTAGSRMYIATTTYTLTSLCRIDSVYFDIEQGSHAGTGYASRETYVEMVRQK